MLLDSRAQVAQLCQEIKANFNLVALDTEFERRDTYYPILSLVQLALDDGRTYAIDVLSAQDITPLKQILQAPHITKILHSGTQDCQIFQQLLDVDINNIFDTQVAAFFNGAENQLSYAALVQDYFNITLDKSLQYCDWLKRPLAANKLKYALADVAHLIPMYKRMQGELQHKYAWVIAESTAQNTANPEANSLEKLLPKLKRDLRFEQMVLYCQISQYRDMVAKQRNVVKRRVIKDELLYEIAKKRSIPQHALRTLKTQDAAYINKLLQSEEDDTALRVQITDILQQINNIDQEQFDEAMLLLRALAEKIGISPRILVSKDELRRYLANQPSNLNIGWRKEVIGDILVRVI